MGARLFLFTDIHANLPALEAIERAVHQEHPDLVIHLGDAVDMGPHPGQVLDFLSEQKGWVCLQGNHEQFMFGWEREGTEALELAHRAWTRSQLSPTHLDWIANLGLQLILPMEGLRLCIQHYAMHRNTGMHLSFLPYFEPSPDAMDESFDGQKYDHVFFGHLHRPVYVQSATTQYHGLMAAGTGPAAQAAYTIVDVHAGQAHIRHTRADYNDARLFADMEANHVPARAFLYQAFYGGRFTPANGNPAE